MENLKTAVLFADRKGTELSPLNEQYSPALLPLAGKTPLEYWFEYLCEQKFEQVFVYVGSFSTAFKTQFPDAEHWGFKLHYLLSRGEELPSDLISRNAESLPHRLTLARADTLPQPLNDGSLQNCITGDLQDDQFLQQIDQLDWSRLSESTHAPNLLKSLADYSHANSLILQGTLWCCTPRGLMLDDGKWTATPQFSGDRTDSVEGTLYVGRESMVDRNARLLTNVSIESNSFIDRGATLKNALILPGTYIGQNVTIEHSIVSGSLMIDLKHGAAQQISDPALISPIDLNSRLTRTHNTERFVAAFLMVLSACILIPLAILTKRSGVKLLERSPALSNRGSRRYPIAFELISFNSRLNAIQRWPQLIHVIDGDMKLFGTVLEPLNSTPDIVDIPLSQGVFTPMNLHPKHQFDSIEAQLWGVEMARDDSGFVALTLRAFKAVLKTCFSGSKSLA